MYMVCSTEALLAHLFLIFYIDDMCQYFHDISGVAIGNISVKHLLFVDDLVLMSETSTGLQRLVDDR